MEILKPENIKRNVWIMTCNNCQAQFKYNSSDIKFDRDGEYVICPCCNKYLSHKNY